MKTVTTKAITLSRTNFGEADRVITMLTRDFGKVRLMARGARKMKSKLAGGIELFTVSDISFNAGRGEVGTLVSCRMDRHFGNIVKDMDRVQAGYYAIKLLNRATEDRTEAEYFDLMAEFLAALNDLTIDLDLIKVWFQSQLLKLSGHSPNLLTETNDRPLSGDSSYTFDYDSMHFVASSAGPYASQHIKVLRLMFSNQPPEKINQVHGLHELLPAASQLVNTMLTSYIRI